MELAMVVVAMAVVAVTVVALMVMTSANREDALGPSSASEPGSSSPSARTCLSAARRRARSSSGPCAENITLSLHAANS